MLERDLTCKGFGLESCLGCYLTIDNCPMTQMVLLESLTRWFLSCNWNSRAGDKIDGLSSLFLHISQRSTLCCTMLDAAHPAQTYKKKILQRLISFSASMETFLRGMLIMEGVPYFLIQFGVNKGNHLSYSSSSRVLWSWRKRGFLLHTWSEGRC